MGFISFTTFLLFFTIFEFYAREKLTGVFHATGNFNRAYELTPNYTNKQKHYSSNSQGLREKIKHNKEKAKGIYRILLIGDSFLYGMGIPIQDNWVEQLRPSLSVYFPNKKIELINTGVPGYNTVFEYFYLKEELISWEPDMVICQQCDNDHCIPNFVQYFPNQWFRISYGLYYVVMSFCNNKKYIHSPATKFIKRYVLQIPWISEGLTNMPGVATTPVDKQGYTCPDPNRVPIEYRHLTGYDQMLIAFEKINELCEKRNVVFIILTDTRSMSFDRELRKRELRHIYINNFWNNHIKNHGLKDIALRVSEKDLHPNKQGHSIIMEAVIITLQSYFKESAKRKKELQE